MFEYDWNRSSDPVAMLAVASPGLPDRKLRLFLVGCCRRRWELFTSPDCRHAVEVAEAFADGKATGERLFESMSDTAFAGSGSAAQWDAANTCSLPLRALERETPQGPYAARCLTALAVEAGRRAALTVGGPTAREVAEAAERLAQANLLRCVAGSPFAYTLPDPRWLTAAAVGIAARIYETREFAGLPVLADALEDAGCDDPAVLAHCRDPRDHARGCWVVDMLLGK